jgi:hypothetical protein
MKFQCLLIQRPAQAVKIGSERFIHLPARTVTRILPPRNIFQVAKHMRRAARLRNARAHKATVYAPPASRQEMQKRGFMSFISSFFRR